MIRITSSGSDRTSKALKRMLGGDLFSDLNRYGEMGVEALRRMTPMDSGLTAQSWGYRIIKERRSIGIEWYNTNIVSGIPVAILIQYGHATGTGGYVQGRDFINPVMRPLFDQIADDIWKKVRR